ncbi:MAG: hypothetical protein LW832_07830 [Parachlamydia sp.]|jgi:hypothetical protein|nr:hypothetical protein [Parachlamydia sp.]
MDELIVENFFRRQKSETAILSQEPSALAENFQEITDIPYEMGLYLDRLEKEVETHYKEYADYQCIFHKIRLTLKHNSVEGIIELLDHLEELLDLGAPTLSALKY